MKRSVLASAIIVALVLASAGMLGAAPLELAYNAPATPQKWVGHDKDQLIKDMGTPDFTFGTVGGGQTIRFVVPEKFTHSEQVNIVEQFDVSSNGRIIAASVSRM